jgi:hypothetical protein
LRGYEPDSDTRSQPESVAQDFADKIAEYVSGEVETPREAALLAETMLVAIQANLQNVNWQERIDGRKAFKASGFGDDAGDLED